MLKKWIILFFTISLLFTDVINVPSDFPTIQEGINNANHSDSIFVDGGEYHECITIQNNSINLIGVITENDTSKIMCEYSDSSIINIESNVDNHIIISNFYLGGEHISNGINIIESNVELNEIHLSNFNGIGINIENSEVDINNFIVDNPGLFAERIIKSYQSELELENGIIENFHSTELNSSIIISLNSNLDLIHITIQNNSIFEEGTIKLYDSHFISQNSQFINNHLEYGHGGVINAFQSNIEIINSNFENNGSPLGGAIYSASTSIKCINSNFFQNSSNNGGAIYQSGDSLQIKNCLFSGNVSEIGGAISTVFADVIFEKSICENNIAQLEGGCFQISSGNLFIGFSNIINNHSLFNGASYSVNNTSLFMLSSILLNEIEPNNNISLNQNSQLFLSHSLFNISDLFTLDENQLVSNQNNFIYNGNGNQIIFENDSYFPNPQSLLIDNGRFNLTFEDSIYYEVEPFFIWGEYPDIGAFEYYDVENMGDINSDEIIDILDIILLLKIIQSDSIDPQIYFDLYPDNEINILDIIELVKLIVDGN
jgi:hypothetical protein